MMLYSVVFLKNSQQTMSRSDEKPRYLYSYFNRDGYVYNLTKKDKFCTLYSSCKFYAVCVQIRNRVYSNWRHFSDLEKIRKLVLHVLQR